MCNAFVRKHAGHVGLLETRPFKYGTRHFGSCRTRVNYMINANQSYLSSVMIALDAARKFSQIQILYRTTEQCYTFFPGTQGLV